MSAVATRPVLSRLSSIIDGLCQLVAARGALPKVDRWFETTLPAALILRVWTRLRRADTLIQALAARLRAGKLHAAQPRNPPAARHLRTRPASHPQSAAGQALPRHFGWLIPLLVRHEAAARANHLRLLLAEPEMQDFIAACPRARRLLAPTCRMLGIERSLLTPAAPAATEPVPPADDPQTGIPTPPRAPAHSPWIERGPGEPPISRLLVPG